ncbi:unnamed protein product [Urochloa decumbens]|uniref:Cysteine-rich receptor-like protein kinase 25 n=1 Tax=Urochloa decumbens TaxID=240449 RepID=A0ABC8W215_9POAL
MDSGDSDSGNYDEPLWKHVNALEEMCSLEGERVKFLCDYCNRTFLGSYSTVEEHLLRACEGMTPTIRAQVRNEFCESKKANARMRSADVPVPHSVACSYYGGIPDAGKAMVQSKKRKRSTCDLDEDYLMEVRDHLDAIIARMFYSSACSSRLPPGAMHGLLLILLCSSLLATAANADDPVITSFCPSNANYTRGGAFQASLDALLSSLPATAASAGFAKDTTGASPNQAYGLAQCRADVINTSACGACLGGTARDLAASNCAGQKKATLVYDHCLLRLSDESFAGAGADTSVAVMLVNPQNATEPEVFAQRLGALMSNLSRKAAYESPRMFAVGSAAVTPFVSVYGMAQCTRDLAAGDCNSCLVGAVASLPSCCSVKRGGQVIYPSCAIRFEEAPFYNIQAAEAAMSPTPAAPPGGGPVNGSNGSNHTVRTALLVSIPVAVALVVVLLAALCLCKRNRKPHQHVQIAIASSHADDEEMRSSESLLYDLNTLRAATNNFSEENKLGEGGFGPVYKGTLLNGQDIAVKRLSATSQHGQVEMKNEVFLLAKLQHRNLVRLLGCCIEEHERLLIYEFLTNNSLDKILFDPVRQQELGWGLRHKIIEGISRGLLYLHEDSRLTIIHRDLKASNILLDADMNPKISDFGLAKLFSIESSVGNTSHIAGTYGYMAPEYALHGIFSAKSDVFSYGVLVLEIVTGRRNTFTHASGPSEDLLTYVWRHWSRGNVQALLEGCPGEGRRPQEMLRCIHVGLLCVQEDPQLRPGMASVVVMLNSRSITLPAPDAPAFALPGRAFTAAVRDADREGRREQSFNDVSVSDLEPR